MRFTLKTLSCALDCLIPCSWFSPNFRTFGPRHTRELASFVNVPLKSTLYNPRQYFYGKSVQTNLTIDHNTQKQTQYIGGEPTGYIHRSVLFT